MNSPMDHRDRPHRSPAAQGDACERAQGMLRVLVAEDGLVHQRVIAGLLKQRGHDVVIAANGREAVEALRRGEFDLVLMDLQMPEMDGLQATAAIRAAEQTTANRVPIVALTVAATPAQQQTFIAAGMDGYLAKPVQLAELQRLISQLLTAREEAVGERGRVPNPPLERQSEEPNQADAKSPAILDLGAARARIPGGDEMVREMAGMLAEESRRLLEQIQDGINDQDGVLIQRAAHTLKGSASVFGAGQVMEAAQLMEQCGKDGELATAVSGFDQLKAQVERMSTALQRIVAGDFS